ncbi:hypothetical protein EVAR_14702_1 [Eumeta japonica]|uniref:Uncharacterized protein n=1 Tax=Eumeta variegata TaxID=151549 RepID=A0A4C1U254_EUMVA|nr:hypothetical protein EVAR_14702_1 [Eumeta japonica]
MWAQLHEHGRRGVGTIKVTLTRATLQNRLFDGHEYGIQTLVLQRTCFDIAHRLCLENHIRAIGSIFGTLTPRALVNNNQRPFTFVIYVQVACRAAGLSKPSQSPVAAIGSPPSAATERLRGIRHDAAAAAGPCGRRVRRVI